MRAAVPTALRFAAREGFVSLLRAEHVAWRMARAAMADALDDIGAPVPKIVMSGIGLERPPPHAAVYNTFNVQRHLLSAQTHRALRAAAMTMWRTAVAAA